MKRLSYIITGLVLSCGTLHADDDYDIDTENISQQQLTNFNDEKKPFRVNIDGDWIGRAKIDKDGYHNQYVNFWQGEIAAHAVVYYNECYEEGLVVGLGYDHVYFKWKENPYFHQTQFNEATLSLSGFSKRACGWLWQAQLAGNYDTKHTNWAEYSNYDITLWGRYTVCDNFRLHTGFIAKTGMKIDHIFPILGFDWAFREGWKLNMVVPVNISLVYQINECWTALIAARFFDVRRRVGKNEPLEKALFEYRNYGGEFGISYENSWIEANVHAGYTFGGHFKISNKNHKHQHNYDFDASPYAGGEVLVKF